jgi:TonB family protein
MSTPVSSGYFVELGEYNLILAKANLGQRPRAVEDLREVWLGDAPGVEAALKEIKGDGKAPAIALFRLKGRAIAAPDSATAKRLASGAGADEFLREILGADKLPANFAVVSQKDGRSPESSAGLLDAVPTTATEEALGKISGWSFDLQRCGSATLALTGALSAAAKAGNTTVLLVDVSESASYLIGIGANGVTGFVAIPVGFDALAEATQNALGLKFRGSAARLMFNESYDFSEAGAKIIEPLANAIRSNLPNVGAAPSAMVVGGVLARQTWLTQALSSAVGLKSLTVDSKAFSSAQGLTLDPKIPTDLAPTWLGVLGSISAYDPAKPGAANAWNPVFSNTPVATVVVPAVVVEPPPAVILPLTPKPEPAKPAPVAPPPAIIKEPTPAPAPAPKPEPAKAAAPVVTPPAKPAPAKTEPAKPAVVITPPPKPVEPPKPAPAKTPPPPAKPVEPAKPVAKETPKPATPAPAAAAAKAPPKTEPAKSAAPAQKPTLSPAPAPVTPKPPTTAPFPQKKSPLPVIIGVVVLLLIIVAGGFFYMQNKKEEAAQLVREEALKKRAAEESAARREAEEKTKQEAEARKREETESAARAVAAEKARVESEARARQATTEELLNARGSFEVNTDPVGATVTVGERAPKSSPVSLKDLRLGRYAVTISMAGFDTETRDVDIKANEITDLGTIHLHRQVGTVAITSDPAGLSYELKPAGALFVNPADVRKGSTPANLNDVPVGNYTITISKPNWPNYTSNLAVERNGSVRVNGTFQGGTIVVNSTPTGAAVMRDGNQIGTTPMTLNDVIPGDVSYTLQLRGLENASVSGHVDAGKTLTLSGTLLDADRVMKLSELDERPVPLQQVEPDLTSSMRSEGGSATIEFVVGADGIPTDLHVLNASNAAFGKACLTAAAKWRFRPGVVRGRQVRTHISLPFRMAPES